MLYSEHKPLGRIILLKINKQLPLGGEKGLCCRMLIPHQQMSDIQVSLCVNSLCTNSH